MMSGQSLRADSLSLQLLSTDRNESLTITAEQQKHTAFYLSLQPSAQPKMKTIVISRERCFQRSLQTSSETQVVTAYGRWQVLI